MDKRIYLCLAHMSESGMERKYVCEAFDTNWVVPLGPNVNGFEADLEAFVGAGKKVVALSSGTAAVHLALLACGVGPGDEVCASSHPVTYLGATPVFVDSEEETWNMDPALLEEAIRDRIAKTGKRPRAIVPVALYGMPYRIDKIMEIANRYDIPVVEDAAEGFGSRYGGGVWLALWRTGTGYFWALRRVVVQREQDDHDLGRRCLDLRGRGEQEPDHVVRHAGAGGLSVLPARGDWLQLSDE